MVVILGLGNFGAHYASTRHNIGFMVAERFAETHGIKINKRGEGFIFGVGGDGIVQGAEVVVAKPRTFMNLSGIAAMNVLKEFDITPDALIVVYDDCDLPSGKIRIRKKGGSGGHRGMESIIKEIHSADFPRVRMGIGRPVAMELKDYVLCPFESGEQDTVLKAIEKAVVAIKVIIEKGVDCAMNEFNAN